MQNSLESYLDAADSAGKVIEVERDAVALGVAEVDAPLCMTCGTKMRPSGSCYVCEGCGSTSGCSASGRYTGCGAAGRSSLQA